MFARSPGRFRAASSGYGADKEVIANLYARLGASSLRGHPDAWEEDDDTPTARLPGLPPLVRSRQPRPSAPAGACAVRRIQNRGPIA